MAELKREVLDFRLNSNEVVRYSNPYRLRHEWKVSKLNPPPENLRFLAGNIIGDLAACLDNMVYALAQPPAGVPKSTKTAFPVIDDPNNWVKDGLPKLKYVDPVYQGYIEALQPYGGDGPKGPDHPLRWLWDLNIVQKHRIPLATFFELGQQFEVWSGIFKILEFGIRDDPVKVGTVVGTASTYTLEDFDKVDVKVEMTGHIRFGQGTGSVEGRPMYETIQAIRRHFEFYVLKSPGIIDGL